MQLKSTDMTTKMYLVLSIIYMYSECLYATARYIELHSCIITGDCELYCKAWLISFFPSRVRETTRKLKFIHFVCIVSHIHTNNTIIRLSVIGGGLPAHLMMFCVRKAPCLHMGIHEMMQPLTTSSSLLAVDSAHG